MFKKDNMTNINNTEILIPKEHSMLSIYGESYYEHIDKIKDKIKKSDDVNNPDLKDEACKNLFH